ncbi:6007_t:CDS:1, partial [Acaulospora colombiana]
REDGESTILADQRPILQCNIPTVQCIQTPYLGKTLFQADVRAKSLVFGVLKDPALRPYLAACPAGRMLLS